MRHSRHRAQYCGGVLMKVKALQGDTVDLLCQRHNGTTQ
ncbi:tail protein X, partial [Klebsiella pneumoniae]